MFPRTITWKDPFTQKEVSREFWFGITPAEIAEMKLAHRKDLSEYLDAIIEAQDNRELILLYKALIEEGVGVREEARFLKARDYPDVHKDFFATGAYNQLFVDLLQSGDQGVKFLTDMFPMEFIHEWEAKHQKSYTDAELLELPEPEFREIAGDWKDMDPHMHGIAMRRQELRRNEPSHGPRNKKPKYKGKPGAKKSA
jgi:hypothetical protein